MHLWICQFAEANAPVADHAVHFHDAAVCRDHTANTANTTNATNTAAAIHYAEHHALVPTVLHHSHYHSGNHLSWTNYSTNHPDYQHDEHDEHYD